MSAPAFEWVDSRSDGMSGFVHLKRKDTGASVRVRWSVTDPTITSQHEAAEHARRVLTGDADTLRRGSL